MSRITVTHLFRLSVALLLLAGASGDRLEPVAAAADETRARVSQAYGRLPLTFEENRGQTDPRVDWLARGPGYTLFLAADQAVLSLSQGHRRGVAGESAVLRMELVGANPRTRGRSGAGLPGTASYFVGSDPSLWHTAVPTYARVEYRDVYPGIDVAYYGNQRQLEYDFIVAPGADAGTIALAFEGADRMELDAHGDLLLHVGPGVIRKARPRLYQTVDGHTRQVSGAYVLLGPSRVGFHVGDYDHRQSLVIDPAFVYSTFLGGASNDYSSIGGIAVDASGHAYVTGTTSSVNFPVAAGSFDTTANGASDAFVTRLDPTGSVQLYSTYLGGSSNELGYAIAVDAAGSAYITGYTDSSNFPVTAGAFDTSFNGVRDAYVAKLNAAGSALLYSTFVGGTGLDQAHTLAVDASGNAYVAGLTESANFPVTAGAFDTADHPFADAFVTEINAAGSAALYSTYLGGSNVDVINGVAVDTAGGVYVTGYTGSSDFPKTAGAFDTTFNGGLVHCAYDAFVVRLNAVASAPLGYGTFLGGTNCDTANAIAVDGAGSAYVAGYTYSTNFPVTAGAFDTTFNGGASDIFVTKLNAGGSALGYSTYLGGSDAGFGGVDSEFGNGVTVDATGRAYVTGWTHSANFPTTIGSADTTYNGGSDGFVTELNAAGTTALYSSFVGGSLDDSGSAIAVDPAGSLYVAGYTYSTNFPTTPAAFDTTANGVLDAFVLKIGRVDVTVDNAAGVYGGTVTLRATLTSGGSPVAGASMSFTRTISGTTTTVGSATTGGDGVAALAGVSLSGVNAGFYAGAIGASFAGDAQVGPAGGTADLTIAQATPGITWTPASPITYGTPLGAAQLSASASYAGNPVAGTFVYTPAAGAVLLTGTYTLQEAFTPADTTNFLPRNTSATLVVAPPATHPVLVVNSTADIVDAAPGDVVCATSTGVCTLRAAVQEANALPGSDTIQFSSSIDGTPVTLTITGMFEDASARGDLDVTAAGGALVISGNGMNSTIVQACDDVASPSCLGIDRIFDVQDAASLDLSGVTLRHGEANGPGGAIRVGVSLSFGGGGGSASSLVLNSSALRDNVAHGSGGAIASLGSTTVTSSTVSGNRAIGEHGGAILNQQGGRLTVRNSTIANNAALDDSGGAIFQNSGTLSSQTWIDSSTISGNAAKQGGAIAATTGAQFSMSNTTVSSNTAATRAGAIYSDGPMQLASVTLYGNSAPLGAALFRFGGSIAIRNTVIAASAGDNCSGGGLVSGGYNLSDDASCGLAGAGDLNGMSAGLVPLADNGGPTWTHLPTGSSPVVDAGNPAGCTDTAGAILATDQRGAGFPRAADGDNDGIARCDIGAAEGTSNGAPQLAVDSANVTVTEGQTAANGGTLSDPDGDTVTLTASVGTVTQSAGAWTWSLETSDGPAQSQTVTVAADDGNGGTAELSFSLGVGNVVPTPTINGAPGTSPEGLVLVLPVSILDPSTVDTLAGIAVTWNVTKNDAPFASGEGATVAFTPDDQGTYVVSVTTTDKDGGSASTGATIVATNAVPTATFDAQTPVNEGSSFALSLTTALDPSAADTAAGFQYAFDCGDGAGYGVFGAAASTTCATSDSGSRAVAASIRDKDGGRTEYTATVVATNVAPTATLVTTSVNEGTPYSVTLADATDVSSADVTAGFSYAFDCGNGAGYGGFGPANTATCAAPDSQTLTVAGKLRDKDGAVTEYSGTVTINNVAPTTFITSIVSPTPPVIVAGLVLTFSGSFSDPSALDAHTVAWDFGDGATASSDVAAGGSTTFSTTHAYATAGTYTVTLTVADDDGGTTSATATVVVETQSAAAVTLVNTVNGLPDLSGGEKNSLTAKLNAAAKANTLAAACNQHDALISQLNALVGSGRMSQSTADSLTAADESIQTSLGCP